MRQAVTQRQLNQNTDIASKLLVGVPRLHVLPVVSAGCAKQNPEKLLGRKSSTKSSEDVVAHSVTEGRLLNWSLGRMYLRSIRGTKVVIGVNLTAPSNAQLQNV